MPAFLRLALDENPRTLNGVFLVARGITIYAARPHIKSRVAQRRHAYKINFAQTLSALKDTTVRLLMGYLDALAVVRLLKSISRCLSIVRPGRSFERKKVWSTGRKFHFSYKRAL